MDFLDLQNTETNLAQQSGILTEQNSNINRQINPFSDDSTALQHRDSGKGLTPKSHRPIPDLMPIYRTTGAKSYGGKLSLLD